MLNIQVKEIKDAGVWGAQATLSGRGVSSVAGEWCFAKTKKQALKILKTRLKKELKIIEAAHYRVGTCLSITSAIIDQLNTKAIIDQLNTK